MGLNRRDKAVFWHTSFDSARETEDGLRRDHPTIHLGITDKPKSRAQDVASYPILSWNQLADGLLVETFGRMHCLSMNMSKYEMC